MRSESIGECVPQLDAKLRKIGGRHRRDTDGWMRGLLHVSMGRRMAELLRSPVTEANDELGVSLALQSGLVVRNRLPNGRALRHEGSSSETVHTPAGT